MTLLERKKGGLGFNVPSTVMSLDGDQPQIYGKEWEGKSAWSDLGKSWKPKYGGWKRI